MYACTSTGDCTAPEPMASSMARFMPHRSSERQEATQRASAFRRSGGGVGSGVVARCVRKLSVGRKTATVAAANAAVRMSVPSTVNATL